MSRKQAAPSLKTSESLEEPGPNWFTLEQAVFYFLPAYTGRNQEWIDTVLHKTGLDQTGRGWTLAPPYGEKLSIEAGELELTIDPEAGGFFLSTKEVFEPAFEDSDFLYCHPQEFRRSYKKLCIRPQFAEAGEVLFEVGLVLAGTFDWLSIAIQMNEAIVMARTGSPLSPFTRIYPDQWRYFALVPDEDAVADGPGVRLFSVFIAPPSRRGATKKVMSKARSLTECQRWLEHEMRSSPEAATATKQDLRAEAKERWPHLSDRGFDDARRRAIVATNATGWTLPGPRAKSTR